MRQQNENKRKDKPDTPEMQENMQKLVSSEKRKQELRPQKDKLSACSKNYYDECYCQLSASTNLCNTYTDNIFTARSFLLSKNPGYSSSDLNKHLNIPDDLDTI